MAYEEFRESIIRLQDHLYLCQMEFLDREGFKRFSESLAGFAENHKEICITGYFSETIAKTLERILKMPDHHVRLLCPELDEKQKRDKKNLQVLRKFAVQGAEVKFNSRLHARLFVAYQRSTLEKRSKWRGLVVVGSFDFNNECIGQERFDAGVKTTHDDLVQSAVQFFDKVWDDSDSLPLDKRYPKEQLQSLLSEAREEKLEFSESSAVIAEPHTHSLCMSVCQREYE